MKNPCSEACAGRKSCMLSLAVVFLTLCIAACGGSDSRPYPSFERLDIVALAAPVEVPVAQTGGELAGKGAATGASAGVASGVLASLMCGPWMMECMGAMVPGLAGAGAVTGSADGFAGMTREDAERVSDNFRKLHEGRDLNQELIAAVSAKLPPTRLAGAGDADARLAIGAQSLRIEQKTGERFLFVIRVATELAGVDRQLPHAVQRHYECRSGTLEVASWLEDAGASFDRELSHCIEEIARQLDRALANS